MLAYGETAFSIYSSRWYVALFLILNLCVNLDIKDESKKLNIITYLVFLLPPQNVQVLYVLLDLLDKVAKRSEINQMTSANLATCIGPNMLRKDVTSLSSMGRKKSNFSIDNLAGPKETPVIAEKDSKLAITLNAKIVSIVEFLIENFHDIWEV